MEPGELLTLGLYVAQQLGIMFGVGATTILLISYLMAVRDGRISEEESRFAHAVSHVLEIGLITIVFSGVIITAMHTAAAEYNIVFQPAFFFKWALIAIVFAAVVMRKARAYSSVLWEGFVGATWYALFMLHIVAPITRWEDLLLLYFGWLVGFMLLWVGLARIMQARPHKVQPHAAAPARSAPEPAQTREKVAVKPGRPAFSFSLSNLFPKRHKPEPARAQATKPEPEPLITIHRPEPVHVAPATSPVSTPAPALAPRAPTTPATVAFSVPQKPPPPKAAPAPFKPIVPVKRANPTEQETGLMSHIDLPAIHIMPRTPEDVQNRNRDPVVQFG